VVELGVEIVDITPKVGSRLCGFGARANKPSTRIDAPIKARVIAIREGKNTSFLINYDLLGIGQSLEAQIVASLKQELGDEFDYEKSVLVSTHTHSGPATIYMTGEGLPDPAYWEWVCSQTVQAAKAAIKKAKLVSLHIATLAVPGLTYNRRTVLTDGRISIVPDPELPIVARGPVDDQLTILVWKDLYGNNVAAIIHYSCHGVAVLTQAIHGDIPGEVCERVGKLLGAPCLYLQGAAGDINPTTLVAGRPELLEWMDKFIVHLSGIEAKLHQVIQEPFLISSTYHPLEFLPLPSEEETKHRISVLEIISHGDTNSPKVQDMMPFIRELMHAKPDGYLNPTILEYISTALAANEMRTLAIINSGKKPSPYPLRLSLWRLGSLWLAFIAAEVFAITGIKIKALHKDMIILPVSYLSPLAGYLPDADSIKRGGYEVDVAWRFYGHVAPFSLDSEMQTIKAIGDLISKLCATESVASNPFMV